MNGNGLQHEHHLDVAALLEFPVHKDALEMLATW